MAGSSVAAEQTSFCATAFSSLVKPRSSVKRSLASQFTTRSEQALSKQFKPGRSVCDKSSVANVWRSLGVDFSELSLALTLPTGQSFRWKLTGEAEYTGVVEKYLFTLRQTPTDVEYMLHNTCACGTCRIITVCHDIDGGDLSTDGIDANKTRPTKVSSSKTYTSANSAIAGQSAITTSYGGSMCSHACCARHDAPVTVNAESVTGVFQEVKMGLTGSHSAETPCRESAIYWCRLHGPQSCCVCLGCAELSLKNYFNLDKSLKELWGLFIAADERFAALAPYMRGARLLRQHPLECLFEFICSSNNHIQRISQMVDHLASLGPYLGSVSGFCFHAFPTLETLAKVTEAELRKAGFGYRAKYIVGTVKELQMKESGGEEWLNSLRSSTLDDVLDKLCTLPGIGPKVAACIALFSLDQHHAIPVDTHVWQIATNYLMPELSGERLTTKMHAAVSQAFVERFGKYAGWAQNVLFIAELSSHQLYLPEHLRTSKEKTLKVKNRKKRKFPRI